MSKCIDKALNYQMSNSIIRNLFHYLSPACAITKGFLIFFEFEMSLGLLPGAIVVFPAQCSLFLIVISQSLTVSTSYLSDSVAGY